MYRFAFLLQTRSVIIFLKQTERKRNRKQQLIANTFHFNPFNDMNSCFTPREV